MQYKANSPDDYINQVPEERKETLNKMRKTIKDNLPEGFEEGIQYNMISYYVPHSIYPSDAKIESNLVVRYTQME